MFHTVVGALELNVLTHIADILVCPTTERPYEVLIRRIVVYFTDSFLLILSIQISEEAT